MRHGAAAFKHTCTGFVRMLGQRTPAAFALLLLLGTVARLTRSVACGDTREEQRLLKHILALLQQGKEEQQESPNALRYALKEHQDSRADSDRHVLEIFPRDLRRKEKFLKHLTGPLHFSPKCRKHVYRLYHNTRDCTVPAYYRRCARLLTRLAGSPQCTDS